MERRAGILFDPFVEGHGSCPAYPLALCIARAKMWIALPSLAVVHCGHLNRFHLVRFSIFGCTREPSQSKCPGALEVLGIQGIGENKSFFQKWLLAVQKKKLALAACLEVAKWIGWLEANSEVPSGLLLSFVGESPGGVDPNPYVSRQTGLKQILISLQYREQRNF